MGDGDDISTGTNEDVPISCLVGNKKSCKRCWCTSYHKYWTALNLFNVLLAICWIGGGVFQALERPNEEQMIEDSRLALNQTTTAVTELLLNQTNMTEMEAMELTERLFEYGRILAEASENLTFEENPQWDWSASVFFSVTVITTIGYGTLAPVTAGGQIFFLFYAVIGIPIALLFLSKVGDIIKAWTDRAMRPIKKRWGVVVSRLTGSVLLFVATLIFFILVPAAILTAIETWNYRESVYYATVTLTTVGFGDFVPGRLGINASRAITNLYKFMAAIWLWMGLALVAAIVKQVMDFFEVFGKWFCSTCCRSRRCHCNTCGGNCKGTCEAPPDEGGLQHLPSSKDSDF